MLIMCYHVSTYRYIWNCLEIILSIAQIQGAYKERPQENVILETEDKSDTAVTIQLSSIVVNLSLDHRTSWMNYSDFANYSPQKSSLYSIHSKGIHLTISPFRIELDDSHSRIFDSPKIRIINSEKSETNWDQPHWKHHCHNAQWGENPMVSGPRRWRSLSRNLLFAWWICSSSGDFAIWRDWKGVLPASAQLVKNLWNM